MCQCSPPHCGLGNVINIAANATASNAVPPVPPVPTMLAMLELMAMMSIKTRRYVVTTISKHQVAARRSPARRRGFTTHRMVGQWPGAPCTPLCGSTAEMLRGATSPWLMPRAHSRRNSAHTSAASLSMPSVSASSHCSSSSAGMSYTPERTVPVEAAGEACVCACCPVRFGRGRFRVPHDVEHVDGDVLQVEVALSRTNENANKVYPRP